MARKTLRDENARLQARIKGLEADLEGMKEFHTRCAKQCDELSEQNSKLSKKLKEAITEMAYDEAQSRAMTAAFRAQIESLSSSIYHFMNGTFYTEEETDDQTTDS